MRGTGKMSCEMKSIRLFTVAARVLVCGASLLLLAASNFNVFASWSKPQSKPAEVRRSSPIFNFYDDEFWLNLHHFLYVLGRAENKTRDSARAAVSGALADQQQGMVPGRLSHALIFFTAGAAVRHVVPEHTPYADTSGVWQRGMTREREALAEIWKPYLDGRGTR